MPIGKNKYKRSDLFGDRFFSFIISILTITVLPE